MLRRLPPLSYPNPAFEAHATTAASLAVTLLAERLPTSSAPYRLVAHPILEESGLFQESKFGNE